MKTFFRALTVVFTNLLTLPWQLGIIVAICLTDLTEEEAIENRNEGREIWNLACRWIRTGRFDEED